ncbi:MAG: lipopolysaccharide heptosyltransferase I [Gammaproteobacteria bacterium]|nr:lipopolysaccharide heptosyltransferase I [Gammaproteobacteria bacterium]
MTKVLIVKTSSMGDVIHMLPAVTDAHRACPGLVLDWVVEEPFAAIPAWHPAVRQVIPVAIRRWRKRPLQKDTWREIAQAHARLCEEYYDWVVDSQGLLKSAWLASWARGLKAGYDQSSVREPLASLFYDHRISVARDAHAIARNRHLLAQALGYDNTTLPLDYGLGGLVSRAGRLTPVVPVVLPTRYTLFLHATSRRDKEWGIQRWIALGHRMNALGMHVLLPWGSEREHANAEAIAAGLDHALVLPRLGLNQMAQVLSGAQTVIGVDTGLVHLAAALGRPTVALYLTTAPGLTGVLAGESGALACNLSLQQGDLTEDSIMLRLHPWLTKQAATAGDSAA